MWQIVIDTAHSHLYLGLLKEGVFIDGESYYAAKMQSEKILPSIEQLLQRNHIKPYDITQAYIGLGPGSYTGVRIGLTVIKTWCLVYDIEVFGFSTFDFLLPQENGVVLLDARSSRAYVGIKENNHWIFAGIKTYDEIKALNSELIVGDTMIVSQENKVASLPVLCEHVVIISKRIDDIHCVEPNYLKQL